MLNSDTLQKKLSKMFAIYDVNSDGAIEFRDFEVVTANLVELFNLPPGSNEEILNKYKAHWNGLMRVTDYNKNKSVNLSEWLTYWTQINGTKEGDLMLIELAKTILELMDLAGEGHMDFNGYQNFIKAFQADDFDLKKSFQILDINQDGIVTIDEAVQMFHAFFFSDDPNSPANALFGPLD